MTDSEVELWRADFLRKAADRMEAEAVKNQRTAEHYRCLADEAEQRAATILRSRQKVVSSIS